jgi:hypothetical protein
MRSPPLDLTLTVATSLQRRSEYGRGRTLGTIPPLHVTMNLQGCQSTPNIHIHALRKRLGVATRGAESHLAANARVRASTRRNLTTDPRYHRCTYAPYYIITKPRHNLCRFLSNKTREIHVIDQPVYLQCLDHIAMKYLKAARIFKLLYQRKSIPWRSESLWDATRIMLVPADTSPTAKI